MLLTCMIIAKIDAIIWRIRKITYIQPFLVVFKTNVYLKSWKNFLINWQTTQKKFSTDASSQANESLNSIMSKKAPKAVYYSLLESADFRYASAVAQKNCGEKYVEKIYKHYELSLGSLLSNHVEKCAKSARIRSKKAKTPLFKAQRRALRKQRSQLRNRRDHFEGETYSSHNV